MRVVTFWNQWVFPVFFTFSQGEIIDVDKMDSPLQTMGMNLSEEEINDLTRDLPADGEYLRYVWIG